MANRKNVHENKKPIENEVKEEIEKEPAKEVESKPAKAEQPVRQTMYVGPTIRGIISKSTIYKNGAPESIIEKIAEAAGLSKKVISALFVNVDELPKVDVHSKETVTGRCYEELIKRLEVNK